MPYFVALVNWTDQGVRNAKDTVKRADAFSTMAEKAGCKVHEVLWTMGPYDIVSVIEAPNNRAYSTLSLSLAKLGNIRTVSMPAFKKDEMEKIVEGVP